MHLRDEHRSAKGERVYDNLTPESGSEYMWLRSISWTDSTAHIMHCPSDIIMCNVKSNWVANGVVVKL